MYDCGVAYLPAVIPLKLKVLLGEFRSPLCPSTDFVGERSGDWVPSKARALFVFKARF
jgi:hypothetical protein